MRATESATRVALLTLLCVGIACCASKPTVRSNVDPGANLSTYHTYGFADNPGTNRSGYSTPITTYFKQAIGREMDSRGYKLKESDPDLLVNFNANAREQVDLRSTPAMGAGYGYYGYRAGLYAVGPVYGGNDVETVRYKVGTANVDIADARQKKLLWEGVAEGKLTDDVMKNPQMAIDSAIMEMFAKFPGRATAP